ncbi:MAG: hypothetical protein H0U74_10055 [Bradymonadaceae bacterium]|nr:hypothetical protein [Lujinxingiaceae bacterium]
MSDIHVSYQWLQRGRGTSELVRREAVATGADGSPVAADDIFAQIANLKGMPHFADVRELRLEENGLADLTPLTSLNDIEVLHLAGNDIVELSPLSSLVKLRILDLSRNPNLESLNHLSRLTALENLSIYQTQVDDLEPIAHLSKLKVLNFSNTRVTDLAPLLQMASLCEVQLFEFGEIERGTDDWNIIVELLSRQIRVDCHGVGRMVSAATELRRRRRQDR